MRSKERVIAALEHREPDRVPIGEMAIDFELTEIALGRPTLYRSKWAEYMALWNGRRDEVVASYARDIVDLVRHFDLDYLADPAGARAPGHLRAARVRRRVQLEGRAAGRGSTPRSRKATRCASTRWT